MHFALMGGRSVTPAMTKVLKMYLQQTNHSFDYLEWT